MDENVFETDPGRRPVSRGEQPGVDTDPAVEQCRGSSSDRVGTRVGDLSRCDRQGRMLTR
jgi:hypothetical protein